MASDTTFYIFRDYTFTANVYNPYNYDISYAWYLGDTLAAKDKPSVKCFFTHPAEAEKVKLVVILNNDTTEVENDGRSHIGMDNVRRRIKEMCGGSVRIESKIGEGTVATVVLPKEGQKNEDSVC